MAPSINTLVEQILSDGKCGAEVKKSIGKKEKKETNEYQEWAVTGSEGQAGVVLKWMPCFGRAPPTTRPNWSGALTTHQFGSVNFFPYTTLVR